ncbi:MAG: nuclear transport factor 2 family protein [Acidobacteriota bacterium]|nr:nuclear transport factor 2 family protein [Acidobacteriota bacterium]
MTRSEQNHAIALLRAAYAAFNRNDISAAVASLAPEIDWSEPKEFPGGGDYHGRDEVAEYLANSRSQWAEGASQPEGFVVYGQRVVVLVHARFRLKGQEEWMEVRLADVYTFHDGTPVQMRAFADRKAALTWAEADR